MTNVYLLARVVLQFQLERNKKLTGTLNALQMWAASKISISII